MDSEESKCELLANRVVNKILDYQKAFREFKSEVGLGIPENQLEAPLGAADRKQRST